VDDRFQFVGSLRRTEAESLVIGYSFDLRTNEIIAQKIPNPRAGTHHEFRAYRASTEAPVPVTMVGGVVQPLDLPDQEGEL
jgi:hypothetical protein